MSLGETIVGLATPAGESAIAMIRISGPLCEQLVVNALGQQKRIVSRSATLSWYTDVQGKRLDHILFTYFSQGNSYTGEQLVEICCHGNPLIVQKVITDLISRGCRHAQPGEFTRTAFLNGKMDLSQAEAVCDLIRARSERAIEAAQKQLMGALGEKISEFTDRILRISAEVEAYIDFPEEDLPDEEQDGPVAKISSLVVDIERLVGMSRYKALLQNGVKTVIIGAPNAGKSSLLNALLGEERAIVSSTPGTTRDFISEQIMVGPYCIRLMDTAGIHETGDEIETLGIGKTLEKIREADLKLLVVDSSVPYPVLGQEVMDFLSQESTLVLENKIDLSPARSGLDFLPEYRRSRISLKTQEGMDFFREELESMLGEEVLKGAEQEGLIVGTRHATALNAAKNSLLKAKDVLLSNEPTELAASELRLVIEAFGEIVGKIDNEDMLDRLFSTFCIGK